MGGGLGGLILVFSFVFVFLWGYLKKFPRPNLLKMTIAVTVFSILVSFLVSFTSVYGSYGVYGTDRTDILRTPYNPVFAQFSLPLYLEVEWGYPNGIN